MRYTDPQAAASTRAYRFPDVPRGLAAIREMRGAGFMLDVTGSTDGDLGITVRTTTDRLDELESIVELHGGTAVR